MKRTIGALLIFLFTPASHAVVIDLSMMTCQEFLASNKDEIRIIWHFGSMATTRTNMIRLIIDTNTLGDNLKKLDEYCAANPTIGLITATNKLFGK